MCRDCRGWREVGHGKHLILGYWLNSKRRYSQNKCDCFVFVANLKLFSQTGSYLHLSDVCRMLVQALVGVCHVYLQEWNSGIAVISLLTFKSVVVVCCFVLCQLLDFFSCWKAWNTFSCLFLGKETYFKVAFSGISLQFLTQKPRNKEETGNMKVQASHDSFLSAGHWKETMVPRGLWAETVVDIPAVTHPSVPQTLVENYLSCSEQ